MRSRDWFRAAAVAALLGAGACESPEPVAAPLAAASQAVVQAPGRAVVFGFQNGSGNGSDTPQLRFWLNHGASALTELTGPNDRQLVGDFRGLGHDQVLFLNYWGGARRTVLADLDVGGGLGDNPPNLL